MVNQILLGLIESVLGKSNPTARGNHAFSCPFWHHKNPKLEINIVPNKKNETYVCDIRMMVSATKKGIKPLCTYARRAKKQLPNNIEQVTNSWEILGTNLSYRDNGIWKIYGIVGFVMLKVKRYLVYLKG